jgi:DtxR family Mn-dependent transcriptional regulator
MRGFERLRGTRLARWALAPARAIAARRGRDRRLVEVQDGLRVLHAAEEHGRVATADSLAGALGITRDRASELVRELVARGLVRVTDVIELTDTGRRSGRAIVRAHRLWERYLADELGAHTTALHGLADRHEHRLGAAELDELAAWLGYPRHDPHGDPIPTGANELPERLGIPLTTLDAGGSGEIVHIEDEPESVYARIAALGLEVGRTVTLREAQAGQLVIDVDGRTVPIDGGDAASVAVVPRPLPSRRPRTLADLGPGESARIASLRVSGFARRRLLDLGFTPGARIERVLTSPFGEPTAYRVRSTLIALRPEQARRIEIEPPNETGRAS